MTFFAGHAAPAWPRGTGAADFLALREGTRPLVIVAPHGGRRRRTIRRGDSVNDLNTAEIAWELAERTGAHAIVNHSLDRNDIDLNRISHLTGRAAAVLELLRAAIDAAAAGGAVPLVLFVHGWNMVVPCCDIGIGLRRRGGQLAGRWPTLSRDCYEGAVATIERELEARGVSASIGRRYTASGRDNAAQLFSGRHLAHEDANVRAIAELSLQGGVDAAQLELGIPLRWSGPLHDALLDGLSAALNASVPTAPAVPARGWTGPAIAADPDAPELEPGFALQAVLDEAGNVALFCGVEASSPSSMTARFCIVATDGSMMLLVGEAEWNGERGRYELEGFSWTVSADGRSIDIALRAPMIRYPTHDAYLDLEEGLAASALVDAEVQLRFEVSSSEHGRLSGSVHAGAIDLSVSGVAFLDRGSRGGGGRERVRVAAASPGGDARIVRSDVNSSTLQWNADAANALGQLLSLGTDAKLREATVVARVPVWRPLGDGSFARWTFGIVRCRFDDEDRDVAGLFDSLEIFRLSPPST